MTIEEIQKEYETNAPLFNKILNDVEQHIVKWEYYRGPFYEITPFSYQRYGYQQGRLVKDIARLKTMRNIFGYGFDVNGNIIEVKEGLGIPEAYNYEFIFKGSKEISILNYNNRKVLRNISFYTLDVNKNIVRMISKGKQGGRIEEYSYCPYPRLDRIKIRQFDESWEDGATLYHSFQYDVDNTLKSISKTPVTGTYTEIIYMS